MEMHLKEETFYSDLYDLWTIERCLEIVDFWNNRLDEEKFKGLQDKTIKAETISLGQNLGLYCTKGERYRNRASTIKEWMDRDQRLDETFEKAQEPRNIRCPNCFTPMKSTSKNLYDSRVLFSFECTQCKKRKGVFDNGEEWVYKPEHCPKCGGEVKNSFKKEGRIETWTKSCSSCDFIETDIQDIDKKEAEREVELRKNEELLKKHRVEFCLSSEEGEQYILESGFMKDLAELAEKDKQKKADPDYEKAAKLKRLTIVELEKFLSDSLEKEKYIKLSFDKPNFNKHVIVPFTIQEADSSRKEWDSTHKLQRIIKATLADTNWRLMAEGVSCRLGYLSGRLKGYEQEEDLVQAVKSNE